MCAKLKENLSREQFEYTIRAAINGRFIAKETVKPYRKDVTAKVVSTDLVTYQAVSESFIGGDIILVLVDLQPLPSFATNTSCCYLELPTQVYKYWLETQNIGWLLLVGAWQVCQC